MHVSALVEPSSPGLARAEALLSPFGLVSDAVPLQPAEGDPRFAIYTSLLGNPAPALENLSGWRHEPRMGNFDGAGGAIDPTRARLISIVESLERYSSCAWNPEELVLATEAELGTAAIGPNEWPRCSDAEFAHPDNPLVPYDPRLPIRWVRGWSLTRRREVFLPAAAVYLRFPSRSRSELFTHPVSTGTAVHSDIGQATLNGLLETVERDSIALTWLQRLRLPRLHVDPDRLDPVTREYFEIGSSTGLRVHLFDATTDFGVPVLYGVQTSDADPVLGQIVAATCDVDPQRALAKIYRELCSLRIALRMHASGRDVGAVDPKVGMSVVGGAVFNAAPEQRGNFDFLLEGDRPVTNLSDLPEIHGDGALAAVVQRLAGAGAEAVVVDLTTDEARQVGMHVVKAMVPQAMPLSFVHRSRFLGTPRLYEAPAAMGLPVHREADVNPIVQPFA